MKKRQKEEVPAVDLKHCHLYDDIVALMKRLGFEVKDCSTRSYLSHDMCRGPRHLYDEQGFQLPDAEQPRDRYRGLRAHLDGSEACVTEWRMGIDNELAYDKFWKCAVKLTPASTAEYTMEELEVRLRSSLALLATKEGYERSNDFRHDTFELEKHGAGATPASNHTAAQAGKGEA